MKVFFFFVLLVIPRKINLNYNFFRLTWTLRKQIFSNSKVKMAENWWFWNSSSPSNRAFWWSVTYNFNVMAPKENSIVGVAIFRLANFGVQKWMLLELPTLSNQAVWLVSLRCYKFDDLLAIKSTIFLLFTNSNNSSLHELYSLQILSKQD